MEDETADDEEDGDRILEDEEEEVEGGKVIGKAGGW